MTHQVSQRDDTTQGKQPPIVVGFVPRRRWRRTKLLMMIATVLAVAIVGIGTGVVRFGLPKLFETRTTTTNVGPTVLGAVQGISQPALARRGYALTFHTSVNVCVPVLNSCLPWLNHEATFSATGVGTATVDLRHPREITQVLSQPTAGRPGRVAVTLILPQPQLPTTENDVYIEVNHSQVISMNGGLLTHLPGLGGVGQITEQQLYLTALSKTLALARHDNHLTVAAETSTQSLIRPFLVQALAGVHFGMASFTIRWQ